MVRLIFKQLTSKLYGDAIKEQERCKHIILRERQQGRQRLVCVVSYAFATLYSNKKRNLTVVVGRLSGASMIRNDAYNCPVDFRVIITVDVFMLDYVTALFSLAR